MAIKYYGLIEYDKDKDGWYLQEVSPHVCIRLKSIFPKIPKTQTAPFFLKNTPENCHDLLWFLDRYPMAVPESEKPLLQKGRGKLLETSNKLEEIFMPGYEAPAVSLNPGCKARDYQLVAAAFDRLQQRFLLGDEMGLGKTLVAILTLFNQAKLPAAVTVQAHLPLQWKRSIEAFSSLKVHIIKKTAPYDLPPADVYIFSYSKLAGWVDIFTTSFFKSAIFDEIQELRIQGSIKYTAAKRLSENVDFCMGMSGTPIYNYGDEIYNVLDLIKPGCLGDLWDFLREWTTPHRGHHRVNDPKALGSYLRDNFLFLRRTRAEVGRELPSINKIVHTVDYDDQELKRSHMLAKQLAMKVISGNFMERGQAARELDALLRYDTGVSKARYVAAFVRILLENKEPVLLAGWHREVYEIWNAELAEFNPVMYTGSESPTAKDRSKKAFLTGETDLFIISLRSGIGLDGLQDRCRTVVIGELDWSPKVHDQVITRVDRDGQPEQVTAYFLVSEYGSDPPIIDMLGMKASQSHGIIDPLTAIQEQYSDESRIRLLAESFLKQ